MARTPDHSDAETLIELYGPENEGWYTTRTHDWIALCLALRDADVRGYLVLRSLIIEKYRRPVRKLSLAVLCDLIPGPNGKPTSSLTRVRGILSALSDVGLISTPDGGPVKTSSRAGAAARIMAIRVNDLPAEGYQGWRNTEAKLSFVTGSTSLPHDAPDPPGRNSDPAPDDDDQGSDQENPAGRNSDPPGRKNDPPGRKDDPQPAGDLREGGDPLDSPPGTSTPGEAPAGRSPGDGRRPSAGSSARASEGGCAASGQKSPGAKKAKHSAEQLDLARQVRAAYPQVLLQQLPDVPALTDEILGALAGDVPSSERTVGQLQERIRRRWVTHGYEDRWFAEGIKSPVGMARMLVRPLASADFYGCANPRCEDGRDVDDGHPCHVCPKRLEDRQAKRRQGHLTPSRGPDGERGPDGAPEAPEGPPRPPRVACTGCGLGSRSVTDEGLCPACVQERAEADRERAEREETEREETAPAQVPDADEVRSTSARIRDTIRQQRQPQASAPF
ncbi:hypothetical protein GA0115246_1038914 [Streptomyces sp. SolWspMP-sol7th]|nr:hypothetical protein GA0115246_1038914 [Streptomyces sp. SolWspMP-sol7th]